MKNSMYLFKIEFLLSLVNSYAEKMTFSIAVYFYLPFVGAGYFYSVYYHERRNGKGLSKITIIEKVMNNNGQPFKIIELLYQR